MFNNFYNIDFKKLVRWNTPRRRRKPKFLALLYALMYAASQVFQNLLRYREAKLYDLMITPQVCYLERLLNDRWDFTLKRIEIEDAVWFGPVFIYQEAELQPQWLYTASESQPIYLYTDGEAGQLRDDFVIKVPIDIVFDESEMRSLVNIFKLAGKRYKIERV